MRLMHFNQFEFDHWEGEEPFTLASELKKVRDSCITNLEEFYNQTKGYKEFGQWQEDKFFPSRERQVKDLESSVISCSKNLCGIELNNDQSIFIHHNEWDLQDILWEDEKYYYRALWCTTA